jgi:hypothetical protein
VLRNRRVPDAAEAVRRSYLKEELTPRRRESPAGTLAAAGFGELVDADRPVSR